MGNDFADEGCERIRRIGKDQRIALGHRRIRTAQLVRDLDEWIVVGWTGFAGGNWNGSSLPRHYQRNDRLSDR